MRAPSLKTRLLVDAVGDWTISFKVLLNFMVGISENYGILCRLETRSGSYPP